MPEMVTTVYPKVKVRAEEQDGLDAVLNHDRSSWPPLETFQSLSINDFNSPVNDCEDDTLEATVRIPKSYVSLSTMPMIPVSKGAGEKNNEKVVEDGEKTNIRASSILRPRAVLSSPDNDVVMRSRNKRRTELLSGLKNHNVCQNRHIQRKVIPRPVVFGSPVSTKKESRAVADDNKTNLKGKRGSVISDPSQRAHLSKSKPRSS